MILALLLTVGCDAPTADSGLCDREVPLTWEGFGEPFMQKHCVPCHSVYLPAGQRNDAPVGVDLDTYGKVMLLAPRVRARVLDVDPPTMPPGGGPDAEELARLDEWLTCRVEPDAEAWAAQEGP